MNHLDVTIADNTYDIVEIRNYSSPNPTTFLFNITRYTAGWNFVYNDVPLGVLEDLDGVDFIWDRINEGDVGLTVKLGDREFKISYIHEDTNPKGLIRIENLGDGWRLIYNSEEIPSLEELDRIEFKWSENTEDDL